MIYDKEAQAKEVAAYRWGMADAARLTVAMASRCRTTTLAWQFADRLLPDVLAAERLARASGPRPPYLPA